MSKNPTQHQWTRFDKYVNERIVADDPVLDHVLKTSRAASLPNINVSRQQAQFLQVTAQSIRARRILEIGTLGGYSAIHMARALPQGKNERGKLITLEKFENCYDVALANIEYAGLSDIIEIRLGDAVETLPAMIKSGEDPFDMIFIDANKDQYEMHFENALKLSKSGTVIIADNVVRRGDIVDKRRKDPNTTGTRALIDAVGRAAKAGHITPAAIQTVGDKGYDGFIMMVVN